MSTPTNYYGGTAVPFDVAAVSAALDRAQTSLKPDERAALTVQVTKATGLGAGLVMRGPWRSEILATLTKPTGGQWGWSIGGRVSFLAGVPFERVTLRLEAPPIHGKAEAPDTLSLYQLFRRNGNGPFKAAIKAARAARGLEVTLHG